ncbi:AAA family ATPase [Microbacterium sp. S308A+]|uniref:AAA family ATPase n=1 Tax=Microbacterium sp. S308A+ TaxID=3415135 RepID=UPI003C7E23F8
MRVILAVADDRALALAQDLPLAGVEVVGRIAPESLAGDDAENALTALPLRGVDALVLPADRGLLGVALRAACDRAGVRLLLLGRGDPAARLARRAGLAPPLDPESSAWDIADALAVRPSATEPTRAPDSGSIIAVWGPHGAPGRTTVAVQLCAALASPQRHVALVDADTHAPSAALLLGLGEDAPGIAAACRRADLGLLDGAELSRLAMTVDSGAGPIDVLAGINRPSRWPELSATRLAAALLACRDWAAITVVDVAAPLETDEEMVSDIAVPRRNAATLTALEAADRVVAVVSADPLGVARFVRDHAELRALVGSTPVTVLVNRLRSGPLGVDARRQIRRALARFSGIDDVRFLPFDPRGVDAALLHGRPVSDAAPRSAFAAAVAQVAPALLPADGSAKTSGATAALRLRRRRGHKAEKAEPIRRRRGIAARPSDTS